jgi:hypothetical protein
MTEQERQEGVSASARRMRDLLEWGATPWDLYALRFGTQQERAAVRERIAARRARRDWEERER